MYHNSKASNTLISSKLMNVSFISNFILVSLLSLRVNKCLKVTLMKVVSYPASFEYIKSAGVVHYINVFFFDLSFLRIKEYIVIIDFLSLHI